MANSGQGYKAMNNKLAMSLSVLTGVAGVLAWVWNLPIYAVAAIGTCAGFAWLVPDSQQGLGATLRRQWVVALAVTLSLLTALWAILAHAHQSFTNVMVTISVLAGFAWLAAFLTRKRSSPQKPRKVTL